MSNSSNNNNNRKTDNSYNLDFVRSQIIGNDMIFETPFGMRNLFYADYTASGRGLKFVEEKIQNILNSYANTHTEDDYSGKFMTELLHNSEWKIKNLVNAGENGKIISVGSGATGSLLKLQQILGIYSPPATIDRFNHSISDLNCDGCSILKDIDKNKPVIFVGPYEHHTNEVMWRESHSTVVVIKLAKNGLLDLEDLENKLKDNKYFDRKKLASFSAGSNITGVLTDVYEVARICHKYNTPILFDYAAIAPYVKIDMNKDKDSYFDAIFFSPHKFLGGPGTSGVLIFNDNLYRTDLAPTAGGGGTVDYVGTEFHDFTKDIETREKAGTPPILQTIKTALIMDLKEKIGIDNIEEKENEYLNLFFDWANKNDKIELIGEIPIKNRVPIISFNLKHDDRYLHPKFVTKLLNDLFGIQSRAGCSCAGPYGHYLLGIDDARSSKYRSMISKGYSALKPGWVRVNLHYIFEKKDIEFIIKAINFIAENGHFFISRYRLNMVAADWKYIGFKPEREAEVSIDNNFDVKKINLEEIDSIRKGYFSFAEKVINDINNETGNIKKSFVKDSDEIEELKFFYYEH